MSRRLFTPGPTPLPDAVYRALATPMEPARSAELTALLSEVTSGLAKVFRTTAPVLTLTASGTGAMEAVFANLARRDRAVLVAQAGKFGARWAQIADAYGVRHVGLERPWGEPIPPAALSSALRARRDVSLVLLTHSETSTGVVHDVEALCAAVHAHSDALAVVDGVSSVGVVPFEMDAWGVDACVSAAHKGFMCPPGLAFAALSPRAWSRVADSDLPRFYFDLRAARDGVRAGGTPWTPAVSLLHALRAGLGVVLRGGDVTASWARVARLAAATRAGVAAAGLRLFARPAGDAVTSVRAPPGLDARELVRALRERDCEVASGQGRIKREVLRIAHMGWIQDHDLLVLMSALEAALDALGHGCPRGAPLAAARRVLEREPDTARAPGPRSR